MQRCNGFRTDYIQLFQWESFKYDLREIPAGKNKAAGKFSSPTAFVPSTVARAATHQRSVTHGSEPATVAVISKSSMTAGM
jgi:hypothetical protein